MFGNASIKGFSSIAAGLGQEQPRGKAQSARGGIVSVARIELALSFFRPFLQWHQRIIHQGAGIFIPRVVDHQR
ncbi:hypothetical protein BK640_31520 [Pseudomonas protegens]|nr:hypothetical protein A1348_19895 [Pseudomonas protegens]PNG40097.1 hypothetical protein A1395_05490 [Pseudomonas protegens]ROL88158.1 hypothetical protein BK639_22155 [Pseudomonas protegens]ROL94832.1 hypothetical protein BK640_31520 [Pseudomonas protegens]ROM04176.1 hypothetical protein BK642_20920 [Pseudomonas protegens]